MIEQHDFIKVGDVMQPAPRVVDGLASVRQALELMHSVNISSLVIDKRHSGDEFGMVTVRDIAAKVIAIDRSVDRTSVYEIMSKPVLTLSVEMNIKYAMRLMSRFGLTRALATENEKLVGIVTMRDMAIEFVRKDTKDGSVGDA